MLRRAVQALGGLQGQAPGIASNLASLSSVEHNALDAATRLVFHPPNGSIISGSILHQASALSTHAVGASLRNNPYKNNPAYIPWTPSKDLIKRKTYQKRMRYLVQTLEKERVQQAQQLKKFPDFRAGDILEVRMLVPENQRKEYVFRGLCIARYNKGIRSSFKIYNVFPEVGGFVQHLPLYMPDMLEVRVVGRTKARRAKLFDVLQREDSTFTYQQEVKPAA